jgi:hypothetical protein
MAARSSTMVRNTAATREWMKSWVRKMAMAVPKIPPMINASKEL